MRAPFSLLLVLLLRLIHLALSANWVQLNGQPEQNYITSSAPALTGRWGAAYVTIRLQSTENGRPIAADRQDRLFVLGGEDWLAEDGSAGRKRNDVWYTEGARIETIEKLIEKTQYNERRPRIVSNTVWEQTRSDSTPPTDIDYRQWLCCTLDLQTWCVDPIDPQRSSVRCTPTDPFFDERRWSPRSMHQAVNVDNTIVVLGGLAQSLSPLTDRESNSGLLGKDSGWQDTTPTNDIWKSTTGVKWELVNPGCYVPQQSHIDLPGQYRFICSDDNDCLGQRLGQAFCFQGSCVCSMWSPRWNFRSISFKGKLYVLGGATWVSRHRCSEYACGDGYIRYLNDIWVSSDEGLSWSLLLEPAPWNPRIGFSVVEFDGTVFLMGGKGSTSGYEEGLEFYNDIWYTSDMLNWEKNNSQQAWGPRSNFHSVIHDNKIFLYGGQEFIPDFAPTPTPLPHEKVDEAVANKDVVNVRPQPSPSPYVDPRPGESFSGKRLRSKNDIWIFDPNDPSKGWIEDPPEDSIAETFVSIHDEWGEHPLLNVTSDIKERLAAFSIFTVADLAEASPEVILTAMHNTSPAAIPDICFYKVWADDLKYRCTKQDRGFDGDFIRDLVIDDAFPFARNLGEERRQKQRENDPCYREADMTAEDVPEVLRSVQCVARPSSRYSGVFASMKNVLYIGLGSQTTEKLHNDFWRRDDSFPSARIVRAPASKSADSVFDFESEEDHVIFQYRLFKLAGNGEGSFEPFEDGSATLVRNWSAVLPPVNLESALHEGYWRFEVRAVDAAGNRDRTADEGRNVHEWEFVPTIPYLLIILLSLLFIIIIVALLLWYRKYRKKKARQKYALARMKRRLKIVESGKYSQQEQNIRRGGKVEGRKRKTKEQVMQEKLEHAEGGEKAVRKSTRRKTARSTARGADTSRSRSGDDKSKKKKDKKKKRSKSKKEE